MMLPSLMLPLPPAGRNKPVGLGVQAAQLRHTPALESPLSPCLLRPRLPRRPPLLVVGDVRGAVDAEDVVVGEVRPPISRPMPKCQQQRANR